MQAPVMSRNVCRDQDDNVTLRTWHPHGPNGQVEKKTNIMPHHEVLLRLDAMDLERGVPLRSAHVTTCITRACRCKDRGPQRLFPDK